MVEQSKNLTRKLLVLMQDTGYPLVQRNGQRKFGPPPEWREPPPKGCELFIGNLPREIFEDELVPIFSRVGKIYEMRLMMNFSGSNRGYAFVRFTSKSEAFRAMNELNGYEIRPGINIGVVKSIDNCRLFVGNIPKTKTKEEVHEELSTKVSEIVDVILYTNCFDRKFNRGFAFVEFSSHRAAAMARRALVPGCVNLWNQGVKVDWAEPDSHIDKERMRRHFDKKEYANARNEYEGIGSRGSPTINPRGHTLPSSGVKYPYTLAPAKLDSICKRYMWAPPVYDYQRYIDPRGTEMWVGRVVLPHVGMPLLFIPRRVGPLITGLCYSMQHANIESAENALRALLML